MSQLLDIYHQLGNEKYGDAVAEIAPYFGTISPKFKDLRPGYCALEIINSRNVHNHLGTMHAIAMCNGAELAAGLTTDVSIPAGRRWIPVEMHVRYLAKAQTDVLIVCSGDDIDWTVLGNIDVPVAVTDESDQRVCEFKITMKVSSPPTSLS